MAALFIKQGDRYCKPIYNTGLPYSQYFYRFYKLIPNQ